MPEYRAVTEIRIFDTVTGVEIDGVSSQTLVSSFVGAIEHTAMFVGAENVVLTEGQIEDIASQVTIPEPPTDLSLLFIAANT